MVQAVSVFAASLRSLKERSGRSYRELARRSLVSTATLHRYCTGRAVPPEFATVLRFAEAQGATRAQQAALHQQWLAARSAYEEFLGSCAEDSVTPDAEIAAPPGPRRQVPAQLPPDVRGFTGRSSYLEKLEEVAFGLREQRAAASACVIAGTAGVGKTALAVHWAHRMREDFPDGQLYLNLRGFDPVGELTAPSEAVTRLLTALGIPPARIPSDLDSQVALYRTELDGKRILVLLDNARDANQVRPLLPGCASAMAVITSRHRLTSLVALNGAEQIILDLLPYEEAIGLLSARLGKARVEAEPQAAADIVVHCARLPLALTVVAALAAQSSVSLKEIVGELACASARLDFLSAGDADSEVRSVFSWSYSALPQAPARLFRLLGLHCGPDISAAAAAALLGVSHSAVKPLLSALVHASLLAEGAAGRYSMHDLLRHYAAVCSQHHDSVEQRELAVERVLRHYLHTAHAADRVLHPFRDPISRALDPADAEGGTPDLADRDQALAWFCAEQPVLRETLRLAIAAKRDLYVWQFTWSMTTFLTRRGPWHDLIWAWQSALQAAIRLDDRLMIADAHRHLAQATMEPGHFDEALKHSGLALNLYSTIKHAAGKGHTQYGLATLRDRQGRPAASLRHVQMAYSHFLEAGHQHGQAKALNGIGWCESVLGDHQAALVHGEKALALLTELDDDHGRADTWDTLGHIHHRLGRYDRSFECYLAAIEVYRRLGDRYYEAGTLIRLGDAYSAAGHRVDAHRTWRHALAILRKLDHRETADVVARLHAGPETP
jgi:tetratricopeptide (TPR) repeat protein